MVIYTAPTVKGGKGLMVKISGQVRVGLLFLLLEVGQLHKIWKFQVLLGLVAD